jgi:hypothetical protein
MGEAAAQAVAQAVARLVHPARTVAARHMLLLVVAEALRNPEALAAPVQSARVPAELVVRER